MTDTASRRKKFAPKAKEVAQLGRSQTGAQAPATAVKESAAKPENKIENVITLLRRPGGALLDELVTATGWQRHTTRAALTSLRTMGHVIIIVKADGGRRYRTEKSQ